MRDIFRVAVAGAVDAGKSTLIGRLLYDTGSRPQGAMAEVLGVRGGREEFADLLDGLEEERLEERTIDTTQAYCRYGRSDFLLIDVPGHAELLKNALCGFSGADAAVVVVDVAEPLDFGLERHLRVLKFLEIRVLAVVINKMDSVGFCEESFGRAGKIVAKLMGSLGIEAKYLIPACAKEGHSLVRKAGAMRWYKGPSLWEALGAMPKPRKKTARPGFYFPVQDVYRVDGQNVVVGAILSGAVRKNDYLDISFRKKAARVQAIRVFGKSLSIARAPASIGLVLSGVEGVGRGEILCRDGNLSSAKDIVAKLFCLQPVSAGEEASFCCATQEIPARIEQFTRSFSGALGDHPGAEGRFQRGDVGDVVLALARPAAVKRFQDMGPLGRFVLKRDDEILAAGIIP